MLTHVRPVHAAVPSLTWSLVAEDVFTEPSGRPSFTSPTYVVQIVGSGAREIHLYDKGFQYFDFSDVQGPSLPSPRLPSRW